MYYVCVSIIHKVCKHVLEIFTKLLFKLIEENFKKPNEDSKELLDWLLG